MHVMDQKDVSELSALKICVTNHVGQQVFAVRNRVINK
jgi:hypothetical protein